MNNGETKNQDLSLQVGYTGVPSFNMAEAMQEELAGLDLTFDKIKIPAGGSITFEVPGDDHDSDIGREVVLLPYAKGQKFIVIGVIR